MVNMYWVKQTSDKPLFPELLWSRPENKRLAGKLLIIGGSASGFSAPAEAYSSALAAGIGVAKVLMPGSLEKTVAGIFPDAEFAPSNASGSFASTALAEFLGASAWADGVLLAGDCGKNSETQIVIEKFISKFGGQLTLANDSLDFFLARPAQLLARDETILVPNFAQLQKLATTQGVAITSQLDLLQLVERIHEFSSKISTSLVAVANDYIIVASAGQISTTPARPNVVLAKLAATVAVWILQNSTRPFEALTSSVVS